MNTFQILLLTAILLSAFPIGKLLARFTKEELKSSKKAFIALIALSILVILYSLVLELSLNQKFLIMLSFLFIIIVTSISLKKSKRLKSK